MAETRGEAMSKGDGWWSGFAGWTFGFPRSCTVKILILGNSDQGAPFGTLEYGVDELMKGSEAEANE